MCSFGFERGSRTGMRGASEDARESDEYRLPGDYRRRTIDDAAGGEEDCM